MAENQEVKDVLHHWMDISGTLLMNQRLRFTKAQGLSFPQVAVLMHLYHQQSCGISEISEHMETTIAAASQLIDRLVVSGFLERNTDAEDRRVKNITLSEKSLALIHQSYSERYFWLDELIQHLTDEEKEKVIGAIQILIAQAEQIARPAK